MHSLLKIRYNMQLYAFTCILKKWSKYAYRKPSHCD